MGTREGYSGCGLRIRKIPHPATKSTQAFASADAFCSSHV